MSAVNLQVAIQAAPVLFIDDDPNVRGAFARAVGSQGLVVHVADSVDNAVRIAQMREYAIIAADYRLPVGDGLTLIDHMQRLQPDAAFMLVSAHCDVQLALEAVNEHQVNFILTKPWTDYELSTLMNRALEVHWERSTQRAMQHGMAQSAKTFNDNSRSLRAALQSNISPLTLAEQLLGVLQARGHETVNHCRRLAVYSLRIADALGITGAERSAIEYGALLHDVGQIAVPDAVLFKTGALTPTEWALIHKHPAVGAKLISELGPGLAQAATIVMQHHERWDGLGYPYGLAGQDISTGARIVALCDTLEAALSERPYRPPRTVDEARAMIEDMSGKHLDPHIVAAYREIPGHVWLDVRRDLP